ncbi:YdcF family protein [Nannocystis sp. ILAH1]|uniref:YdcF family protein n=1 Tax=unclassified Nannocystis TaxID=2627009 RepID=UPI00226FF431|nr:MULTISPECIES: YdcF family protein [unclassified Nannocystis]MCY0987050.1 YdcF family protein [Nannocystis sp. ILAH1]MCY1071933.1 YdcF family protein [Nannocystis sp. RBIL2]
MRSDAQDGPRARARAWLPDTALALGVFVALNVLGAAIAGPRFDVTGAWISLPEGTGSSVFKAMLSATLIARGLGPLRRGWARVLAVVCLLAVALAAAWDTAVYFALLLGGRIATPLPFPSSVLVLALSLALAVTAARSGPARVWSSGQVARSLATAAGVACALPLLLMLTFGPTRYAREADAIVVFGARVYSDGTPSLALADRVDEGIRLYHRGLAPSLIMSGAIDEDHGVSEPQAMKARAIAAGVPASAIVLDELGVDTAATVEQTAEWLQQRGVRRVLAVSHYYHQPRVKLLFERAGVLAYTVPATMSRRLLKEPWFVGREVLAYYAAWLSPFLPER